MKEVRDSLKDKIILRIDQQYNLKELSKDFIIIFTIPDKKFVGHIVVRIKDGPKQKKELNELIKILDCNFDKAIGGFKNWKKLIRKIK